MNQKQLKIRALVNLDTPIGVEIPAWLKWRILRPYAHLRKNGIDANVIFVEPPDLPNETDIDILVVPRLIVGKHNQEIILDWFAKLRARGICIVFEADDDMWSESYVQHISQISLQVNKINQANVVALLNELDVRREAARWMINECDAVTVSTHALYEYVKTITSKPVYVVENAIDVDLFERGLRDVKQIEGITTIGWFGGNRAISELEMMIDAWTIIAEQRNDVLFSCTKWLADYLLVRSYAFAGKLFGVEWEQYESYSNNLQVDIGCCSVDNTAFCLRKSVIKSWEYALAGALPIGTKALYGSELQGTLIADNVNDYAMLINWYIDHPEERVILAEMSKEHVLSYHNLKYEYINWQQGYTKIKVEYDNKAVLV